LKRLSYLPLNTTFFYVFPYPVPNYPKIRGEDG
jgi:hypothetical protein